MEQCPHEQLLHKEFKLKCYDMFHLRQSCVTSSLVGWHPPTTCNDEFTDNENISALPDLQTHLENADTTATENTTPI